jgi:hypothetical protein
MLICDFMQAACPTSRRKAVPTASSQQILPAQAGHQDASPTLTLEKLQTVGRA